MANFTIAKSNNIKNRIFNTLDQIINCSSIIRAQYIELRGRYQNDINQYRNESQLLELEKESLEVEIEQLKLENERLIADYNDLNDEKNKIVDDTIRNILADFLSNIGKKISTPITNPIEMLKFYLSRLTNFRKEMLLHRSQAQNLQTELDNCRADG